MRGFGCSVVANTLPIAFICAKTLISRDCSRKGQMSPFLILEFPNQKMDCTWQFSRNF